MDGGLALKARSELDNALDAAVLAGALELPNTGQAGKLAQQFLDLNESPVPLFDTPQVTFSFPSDDVISARATLGIDTTFAGVLGFSQITVGSSSAAQRLDPVGITPISAEDFTNLWAHARYAFDPSLFTFVSSPDDKLAGFAGAFLDLGDPLRTMRGKDHSLARMRFSVSRSLVDRILFYLGGMTPEEEAKGSGLGRAGCSYILKGGCRRKWVRRTVPYGRFWLL